jgi:hypothetical protein
MVVAGCLLPPIAHPTQLYKLRTAAWITFSGRSEYFRLQAQFARCWVAILFGGCLAEKGKRWGGAGRWDHGGGPFHVTLTSVANPELSSRNRIFYVRNRETHFCTHPTSPFPNPRIISLILAAPTVEGAEIPFKGRKRLHWRLPPESWTSWHAFSFLGKVCVSPYVIFPFSHS